MTGEERKALSFVAILMLLSVLARAANRPKAMIVGGASPVDISARLKENEAVSAAPSPRAAPARREEKPPAIVDLNRATAAELDALPGIGPAVARRIVEYREANGRFTGFEQLDSIKGIGPALLERLKPRVKF